MTALPQPDPDRRQPAPPPQDSGRGDRVPVSIADASTSPAPPAPPPHLLWQTLESIYAPADESEAAPDEKRLSPNLALPMAVAVSLVLWVIIVELVMMR